MGNGERRRPLSHASFSRPKHCKSKMAYLRTEHDYHCLKQSRNCVPNQQSVHLLVQEKLQLFGKSWSNLWSRVWVPLLYRGDCGMLEGLSRLMRSVSTMFSGASYLKPINTPEIILANLWLVMGVPYNQAQL
eukprot:3943331-Amphidinium_carterae.2